MWKGHLGEKSEIDLGAICIEPLVEAIKLNQALSE